MDELNQIIQTTAADSRPLVDAIAKVLKEMQRSFSDTTAAVNEHSEGLEGHHSSLYNAVDAVQKLQKQDIALEAAVKVEVEAITTRLGLIESAVGNINRDAEASRNKVLNVESLFGNSEKALDARIDTMTVQLQTKISEMDDIDTRMKQAIEKSLNESAGGQKIMELLSGGLGTHSEEISALRGEAQHAHDQLFGLTTQLSEWHQKQSKM
jgi:hypothetical protein